MMKRISLTIAFVFSVLLVFSQDNEKRDIHKTIFEVDFTFNLYQKAKNKQGNSTDVINQVDHFFGFRYTNAWFVTNDLSVGFGIGLELAPVTEWPLVLDVRKYFGDKTNRNYLVFNAGKAMDGYNGMKTLLGELGYGRNIKLGRKTSLNFSLNYQLTYLKDGDVKKTREIGHRVRVRDFYTHSLGVKIGLMF